MKTIIPSDGTIKWPEPKPIDWTRFIEPMYQDFETRNGLAIAIFLNRQDNGIRKDSRRENAGNNSVES